MRACNKKKMKIAIVNNKDEVIGFKERGYLDNSRDIYRVSALWITNTRGEVLLAKRAFTKKQNPGKWGPAVAGTVEEGESYESNILKESGEEIGLKNIKPKKAIKEFVNGKHKHFTQWFFLKSDIKLNDLNVNTEEVAEVKWFEMEEVFKLIKNNLAVTLTNELLADMENRT